MHSVSTHSWNKSSGCVCHCTPRGQSRTEAPGARSPHLPRDGHPSSRPSHVFSAWTDSEAETHVVCVLLRTRLTVGNAGAVGPSVVPKLTCAGVILQ
ncbi:hypothetical protein GN956_G5134 [Arapaima gigas]